MAAADEAMDEATLSLIDVIEEDELLQDEASAVLGGSDSEKCSYPEGYVKRQALYACNTCTPKGGEPAGICLACSYKCHEGHDLFELYTKRNFRCDCGNGKFVEMECKLYPEKDTLNTENKYSHNFFGLYCTCNRPYPDPEDQEEDEMIQCIICEDWLHGRHLGCPVPECVELQEMVCEACINKNSFLWTYAAHLAVPPVTKSSPCKAGVEVRKEEGHSDQGKITTEEPSSSLNSQREETTKENGSPGCKRTREEMEGGSPSKHQQKEGGSPSKHQEMTGDSPSNLPLCRFTELKGTGQEREQSGAAFWPLSWRTKLCSCVNCRRCYADAGVSFLVDESDTVLAYETKGKTTEQEQQGGDAGRDPLMLALNNLNRVQQLEIIYGYNDMKTELKDFLQRFADEGKVVTPEDIRQFFEQQQSRKRRRANAGQYYCS